MAESNLARSLFSENPASIKAKPPRKKNTSSELTSLDLPNPLLKSPESVNSEAELKALRQEVASLRQHTLEKEFLKSLQSEYTASQKRIKDLENQVSELQEQILEQVGQAVEHEAAIQHWKEKCVIHQNHAVQLSNALERVLEGKDPPKSVSSLEEYPEVPTGNKVDLPAFLIRQKASNS